MELWYTVDDEYQSHPVYHACALRFPWQISLEALGCRWWNSFAYGNYPCWPYGLEIRRSASVEGGTDNHEVVSGCRDQWTVWCQQGGWSTGLRDSINAHPRCNKITTTDWTQRERERGNNEITVCSFGEISSTSPMRLPHTHTQKLASNSTKLCLCVASTSATDMETVSSYQCTVAFTKSEDYLYTCKYELWTKYHRRRKCVELFKNIFLSGRTRGYLSATRMSRVHHETYIRNVQHQWPSVY